MSLYDIENRDGVFPSVHRSYKFCLLTLGAADQAEFVCFASQVDQLSDPRRRFTLSPDDFRLINPNTLTCPVFRSARDAELTKKLYRAVPVLMKDAVTAGEGKGTRVLEPAVNPWGITFSTMFHMSNDSHLFAYEPAPDRVPLYEAKLIHQFDHRWATYTSDGNSRDMTLDEKQDPDKLITPRYWVSKTEVQQRLRDKGWTRGWLMGWRRNARATDERTTIATVMPLSGQGDSVFLWATSAQTSAAESALLLANLCTLVFDFVARQKVGGVNFSFYYFKQLPALAPSSYERADKDFIIPRILELSYTAHDLADWAQDLGHDGPPFTFDPDRRSILRAELDAYYARLYGLTRDELRYILDPTDVMGDDYPSETFRVLKDREEREFGEYRTRRLVLEAWDKLECGALR